MALKLSPNYVDAHYNFAILLAEKGQFEQAKKHYQKTLKLNPVHIKARNNLANILTKQGCFNEAENCYQVVLESNSNNIDAHNNLGVLLKRQKSFYRAEKHYQIALKIDPKNTDTQWNLSLLQLQLGDFHQGWMYYESRYREDKKDRTSMNVVPPNITTSQYQGESLKNKRILICAEQGIGDEIMFASVLSELKAQTQSQDVRITLVCDARLVELFNQSFDFLTAIPKNPNNCCQTLDNELDYWLFIGSLPKFYRNDIKDFSQHQPYLKANNVLFDKWQERFSKLKHTFNIGISWATISKKKTSRLLWNNLPQFL
ncbi:hypothetical protein [uncultured Gammaproteobacteria bacterium]|nr:hypothetical protein [uncultured Gammaproteobacteria bacterium]CAC9560886.1 hypothetical protein [uncultured Gammaproteobacteria bacterium]CAC9565390.1 hypothetical protein [uncultured Gammaproteobacteria bacterium]